MRDRDSEIDTNIEKEAPLTVFTQQSYPPASGSKDLSHTRVPGLHKETLGCKPQTLASLRTALPPCHLFVFNRDYRTEYFPLCS